jgi:hypothetical protein
MTTKLSAPPRGLSKVYAPPLIRVRSDATVERCRRRGRFAISRPEAASFHHLERAVKQMQKEMVDGLKRVGYRYIDNPDDGRGAWEFEGPVDHIDFEDVPIVDNGPIGRREIDQAMDREAFARFERAEHARKARRFGLRVAMVDYFLIAMFERRVEGDLLFRTYSR